MLAKKYKAIAAPPRHSFLRATPSTLNFFFSVPEYRQLGLELLN
jgi:hypothetical protein